MKNILHYGLQRSGTNVLETYLCENFRVKFLNNNLERNNTLHKHFRLFDNKHFIPEPQFYNDLLFKSFKDYERTFGSDNQIDAIFVISKDPYSWYLSYMNWAKKCNWSEPNYHYIEEYNEFHNKWIEFSKQDNRISIVKYIDLISNPIAILNSLKTKHNLSLKLSKQIFGIRKSINKVSESEIFTEKNLRFYTQKEYLEKLGKVDIEIINSKLDLNVLKELTYEIENI